MIKKSTDLRGKYTYTTFGAIITGDLTDQVLHREGVKN